MLQHIKGFFQIILCTAPAITISKPNKLKIPQISCFQSNGFITSGCFIQFRATAGIKVCLYSINSIVTFHNKIKSLLRSSVI